MQRKLFVAGEWRAGAPSVEIKSPFDGRVVSTVGQGGADDVEAALKFAWEGRTRLAALSTGQRRSVLFGMVGGLVEREEELARLISDEAGKPITAARTEVKRATETFRLAASELPGFGGRTVPVDLDAASAGYECETRRFPAGVVVGIVPFNFPLNLGAHKVAPALAVGAPIIVKPPPQAPSAQLVLAEIAQAAGADPAALQVIPCSNAEAEKLATDPRARVLSFTGSAKVGWMLKAKAPGKVILELGGNAAVIVCADAELPWAIERCTVGGLTYAGQVCIKVQRIFVEAPVHDAFVQGLLERIAKIRPGDPREASTLVGPVIDDVSAARIEEWIQEAKDGGAKVLHGGTRSGRMVEPTVLTDVPAHCRIAREEVFGPVIVLGKVASFDDALRAANESAYGLQAGVFTRDLHRSRRAFRELEVGGVILNDYPTFRADNYPYGGVKGSGLGREGVRSTMEDYTEERVLVTRNPR